MMTPEERVKARGEFKASLANMTKEELEALAAKLTEESKETDSKVANLNYTLENKGQKAAWDAIKTFLDKQSVKWNYALGLITLYEFFDKAQKEISFAMLDTVLRLLGSLEYTGYAEWKMVTTINDYFTPIAADYRDVTDEIYDKLPIKYSESIVISSYPVYNEEEVFEDDYEDVSKVISDLTEIRNLKVANNVKKDAKVLLETNKDLEYIYRSQLKIMDDNLVNDGDDCEGYQTISYQSSLVQITYYFENEINKEQIEEDIKKLQASIERREKLLANENYVNKAPKNIVDMDREKLKEEQEKLLSLQSQL